MRYAEVGQRELKFLDMTSLTVEEFAQIELSHPSLIAMMASNGAFSVPQTWLNRNAILAISLMFAVPVRSGMNARSRPSSEASS